MRTIPIMSPRQCGDCRACCEGLLAADIYGSKMYPGKPCHYICDSGCSIYDNRPEDICVKYNCIWLVNNTVPGWLKPNKCGAILTEKEIDGMPYIEAVEMENKLDSSVLSWLLMQHLKNGTNLYYTISGGKNWVGSAEFVQAMENRHATIN